MGKTFDRYVLGRFCVLFVGFFISCMGLFAVVDGFTNLDGFQQKVGDEGTLALLKFMARNYAYRSGWIFDLIGPTLATMSVVAVLALMVRHGEVNPLLAAGVPAYRLTYPFLIGITIVHVLLALNKELVLPRIAVHLAGRHGQDANDGQPIEPVRDAARGLVVYGRDIIPATGVLRGAEFRLSRSPLVDGLETLRASSAVFHRRSPELPAGWLLKEAHPLFQDLRLTEAGQKSIIPRNDGRDLFLVTDVTPEQLMSRGTHFHYISTPDLIERVQHPSAGTPIVRAQVLQLHARLTRPLLNIVGLFLAIPLVIRRESRSQVTNLASCMAALALIMGLTEACQFLGGKAAFLSPEAATWIPLIVGGGLCAWLSPRTQT